MSTGAPEKKTHPEPTWTSSPIFKKLGSWFEKAVDVGTVVVSVAAAVVAVSAFVVIKTLLEGDVYITFKVR